MRWSSRFILLPLLCLAATAEAALSRESPFAPKGGAPAASQAAEPSQVEFRGVFSTPAGLKFGIYEPAKQQGSWVGLNEGGGIFLVRSYDAAKQAVSVEIQGKLRTIPLKEPEYGAAVPMAPPQQAMPPVAGMQPRPILTGVPVPVAQPNTTEEAKRLEQVAAEVRRRRAARQATTTGTPVPPPPQAAR